MKATFSHELLLVGLVLWGTAAEGTHARRDIFGNAVGNTPDIGSIVWAPIVCTAFGLRTDQILPSLLPGMPLHEVLNCRGKRIDPTGDYWWGARYYDPAQGQFTSHDPMGCADGSNPYAFCLNNPLVWQDADGRLSADAWKGFNQGIEAASIAGRGFDYNAYEHSYWARGIGGMIGYNLGLLNNVAKIPFQAAADINTLGQQTFGSDWDAFTLYTGVHFFEAQQAADVAPFVFDQMSARIQAAIASPEIRFVGAELNPSQAGRPDLSFLGRTFGGPGRSIPGIASGSDGLADVTGVWLRGSFGERRQDAMADCAPIGGASICLV